MIYEKAIDQAPSNHDITRFWGTRVIYIEWAEDGFVLRDVEAFENGNVLRYDRNHWVDSLGMMKDGNYTAMLARERTNVFVIDRDEFEQAWRSAETSPTWTTQLSYIRPDWEGDVHPVLKVNGLV